MSDQQAALLALELIYMYGRCADSVTDAAGAVREHADGWCEDNDLPKMEESAAEAVEALVLAEYKTFERLYHRPDAWV